ncbi:MAG: hypothetical protein F6J93_18165 [Oscillatoria sp. SIO1A7]|nr:hypothetical protein [Oscillatoria sp. SIO1A7]
MKSPVGRASRLSQRAQADRRDARPTQDLTFFLGIQTDMILHCRGGAPGSAPAASDAPGALPEAPPLRYLWNSRSGFDINWRSLAATLAALHDRQ